MIPIPVQLFPTRFTLKTMFVGMAAGASIATLFSQIARPPEQAAFALLLGIILPTLWVGSWRQFTLDRLLAQVLAVSFIDLMLVERQAGGRMIFMLAVALSLLIPSVVWYVTCRMEAGDEKDKLRRSLYACVIGLALVAGQVAASFIIVSVVVR
jgi:hypothetical protein